MAPSKAHPSMVRVPIGQLSLLYGSARRYRYGMASHFCCVLAVRFGKYTGMRSTDRHVHITVNGELLPCLSVAKRCPFFLTSPNCSDWL